MVLPVGFTAGRLIGDSGPVLPDMTTTGHYVYSRNASIENLEDHYHHGGYIYTLSKENNQTITVSKYDTSTATMSWSKNVSLNSTGTGVSGASYSFNGGAMIFARNLHDANYLYIAASIGTGGSSEDLFFAVLNKSNGADAGFSRILYNNSGWALSDYDFREIHLLSTGNSPSAIFGMAYDNYVNHIYMTSSAFAWGYQSTGFVNDQKLLGVSGSYVYHAYWGNSELRITYNNYNLNSIRRYRAIDFGGNGSGYVRGGYIYGSTVVVFGWYYNNGYKNFIYADNTSLNASNNPITWDGSSTSQFKISTDTGSNQALFLYDQGSSMHALVTSGSNPTSTAQISSLYALSGNNGAGPYAGYNYIGNERMDNNIVLAKTYPNYGGGLLQVNIDDFSNHSGSPATVGSNVNYTWTNFTSSLSTFNFGGAESGFSRSALNTVSQGAYTSSTSNHVSGVISVTTPSDTILLEYAG
jgi:hypothetical protein